MCKEESVFSPFPNLCVAPGVCTVTDSYEMTNIPRRWLHRGSVSTALDAEGASQTRATGHLCKRQETSNRFDGHVDLPNEPFLPLPAFNFCEHVPLFWSRNREGSILSKHGVVWKHGGAA